MSKSHPELHNPEWLRQRYVVEQRTLKEIAAEVGCTDGAVCIALQRNGIAARTAGATRILRGTNGRRRFHQLDDAEWLRARYVDDDQSLGEIADLLGCTSEPVREALLKHGIPIRPAGQMRPNRFRSDRVPQLHDPAWMRRERIEKGRSLESIGAELGVTPQTVATFCKRFELRQRQWLPPAHLVRQLPPITRDKAGYVLQYDPEHPGASRRGYVLQHRLAAEAELSRLLNPDEVVHHLNENPSDNRPENLIVFPSNGAHMSFHANPPAWIPRCECCGKAWPEKMTGRPAGIPLLYTG